MLLPFGFLLCGLTLIVSMLGGIKPTNHTTDAGSAISIIEYPRSSYHDPHSLLAFIMLNGVTAVILTNHRKNAKNK